MQSSSKGARQKVDTDRQDTEGFFRGIWATHGVASILRSGLHERVQKHCIVGPQIVLTGRPSSDM